MQATTGLRDNHTHGSVAHFFEEKTKSASHIAMVTAYFTVFAYIRMKPVLDRAEKIRLLFGDPAFIGGFGAKQDHAMFTISDEAVALLNNTDQRASVADCLDWFKHNVEVRSVIEPGFLHGKMAHISTEHAAHAIVGSSNFTIRGLGLANESNNVELNLIASDDRDRDALLNWFNQLWEDETKVQDVRAEVIEHLERFYQDQSPEFIYQKTLFHVFGGQLKNETDDQDNLQRSGLKDSVIWNSLFDFQKRGVEQVIKRIKAHHGCVLADSVGLGKTYTALAVIKYFQGRGDKVLVLCPKKLEDNWRSYLFNAQNNPIAADKLDFNLYFHTDLGRSALEKLDWGVYDLVVIDESHNFRNNRVNVNIDEQGHTRYQFLMTQLLQKGVRSKVLLLSATPVNNSLKDLRNQLSLIAGADVAKDAAQDRIFANNLGLSSVDKTMLRAQKKFINWAKKPLSQRKKSDLMTDLGGDFTSVLDQLTIARSREQIKRVFTQDFAKMGGFPVRSAPVSHYVTAIDKNGLFPNYDAVSAVLNNITLAMFLPSENLRADISEEVKAHYQVLRNKGLSQNTREKTLVAIMKVLLLKRLESSIYSFTATLGRTIANIDVLLARIERHAQHVTDYPDLDLGSLSLDALDDPDGELSDILDVGKKLKYKLAHIDLQKWSGKLKDDKTKLQSLYESAVTVTPKRDQKLLDLKMLLLAKLQNPTTNKLGQANNKTLVFTAFADTAQYLYDNLKTTLPAKLGLVKGGDGAQTLQPERYRFAQILTDFSPVSKKRSESTTGEIDILIATDCISEGQNLQDCDTVINYDIHWNPVRIIQRFGRVDRIGSQASTVHMHNFWPTDQLDRYIRLKDRVESRMALVDMAATGNDNLLDTEQIEDLVEGDVSIRNAQLQRLSTDIFDLDDDPAQVTLADLSLDEFRQDLLQWLQSKQKALEDAPLGLFAVVPPDAQISAFQTGTLFCLRQKATKEFKETSKATNKEDSQHNALHDYFLLYTRDDGVVHMAHTQAKAVLNIWRGLCVGKTEAYAQLCRVFDVKTSNCRDMSAITTQLKAAAASIKVGVLGIAVHQLASKRDFILPAKLDVSLEENAFELVTWLVVQA